MYSVALPLPLKPWVSGGRGVGTGVGGRVGGSVGSGGAGARVGVANSADEVDDGPPGAVGDAEAVVGTVTPSPGETVAVATEARLFEGEEGDVAGPAGPPQEASSKPPAVIAVTKTRLAEGNPSIRRGGIYSPITVAPQTPRGPVDAAATPQLPPTDPGNAQSCPSRYSWPVFPSQRRQCSLRPRGEVHHHGWLREPSPLRYTAQ
jgi:hypothetical protein